MSTLPEKILELAQKVGFETELRVADQLRSAGWSQAQNVYYIDKDEAKGRELDIRAHRGFASKEEDPKVTCRIFLCIEVKRTLEPFIFFTSPPDRHERGMGYGLFHWKNRVTRNHLSYVDIERKRPGSKAARLGRSYAAFKDGKGQQIQSGVLSAVKAVIYNADNTDETWDDTSRDICFFIPVLVIDGPLWECFIDEDGGKLSAKEIDEVVYVQNYLSENYGDIRGQVHVMTPDKFYKSLKNYTAWGNDLLATMIKSRKAADPID